jgi:hypothetical protein
MNTFKGLVLVSLLSLGALPGTAGAVRADNWHAVVTIRNPTANTLKYQFRWGTAVDWAKVPVVSIAPYSTMTHSYPYRFANQNSSPPPEIRFHSNPGAPPPFFKTYRLVAYAAPYAQAQYGKPYTFKYDWSGRYLDLHNGF